MPVPTSREELEARRHILSRSQTPIARRLAIGLPLYSCSCGRWTSEDTSTFAFHVEIQPVADRIADDLTNELDLSEGMKVVYVLGPPTD